MGKHRVIDSAQKAMVATSLCALSVTTAHAVCPAANQFNFTFATATAATLNYANTFSYTATNGLGQSQAIGVSFISNGTTSTIVGGQQMPAITTLINDGGTVNRNLVIGAIFAGRTANVALNNRIVAAVFTFPTPVRDFSVQVNDVDFTTNQFRDWLMVTGTNGSLSYVPTLTTPFGQSNATGGTRTSASSSQALGATTTPVTITNAQSVGTGASGNNANTGTLTASFIEPVTRIEVRYGNYPLQAGETATGQQAVGIQAISFCPMPQLTFAKASAPFITSTTDPARFNTPGSDVIYSLTLTNSNSSPVDLNQVIVTDPLPPQVTFFNGDIDGGGPLTTNFEFIPGTSGLTFAPANLTYSNNGGTSYSFIPATGYDPNVNAIRLNPQGIMAANSSFTLRFRARIK
jgi:uncharacterized repeat protein (TIGR01451 family)